MDGEMSCSTLLASSLAWSGTDCHVSATFRPSLLVSFVALCFRLLHIWYLLMMPHSTLMHFSYHWILITQASLNINEYVGIAEY